MWYIVYIVWTQIRIMNVTHVEIEYIIYLAYQKFSLKISSEERRRATEMARGKRL